ncbi:unnamed protein product [Cylicocyclus nassatus]|uniref:Spindle assembly checkpoint component MAD1 n=1 Tax=Cylicocyclus nassatus TaxID=53992 RepID=A0AA36H9X7_CYLNA|nr:unnamed protein product [Cylicocyclus nassatus]
MRSLITADHYIFQKIMYRGGHIDDEDDEGEVSEATIQLSRKITADFRKAFPLRGDSARKTVPVATPSLSQISKRLNFDDSFTLPSAVNTDVKMFELKEHVHLLETKLSNTEKEIERFRTAEKAMIERAEQQLLEIVDLKKELIRRNDNTLLDEAERRAVQAERSRDEWQDACARFHRYFRCAKARLEIAEKELQCRGNMTEDLKKSLDFAWTSSECRPEEINSDNVRELLDTAAHTLEDLNKISVREDVGSSIFREPSPIQSAVFDEGNQSVVSNLSESILNSTLANTSIDYEKDEKIQRLELENSQLKDRLTVYFDRAQKSMLMEEKKTSAEQKYHLLEKKMEEMLSELNSLRSACSKKIFDVMDTSTQNRAAEIMKRVQDLNDRNEVLQKELECARLAAESARSKVEVLTNEREELAQTVDNLTGLNLELEASMKREKNLAASLSQSLEKRTEELESVQREFGAARSQIQTLEGKLLESTEAVRQLEEQLKHAKGEATDAGDETQILHLRFNPLQSAVDEEQERARKRRADETFSAESSEAKRARDEQIHALEAQLKRSEREKEEALRLQADLAKKYREFSTTLTGYQIKLKDVEEGICCVNSVYDDTEKQFVFKYNSETGIVDLLDVGQDVLSQGRPWEHEMQKYIGERHSIPGFLAAVTLQLEARRNLTEEDLTNAFHTFRED